MGDETKQAEASQDEAARTPDGGETPPALRVIGAFGGIRPMAGKLDVPVSTVQGWKERGVIPESRHEEIRAAATAHGVTLDDADLAASADGPPAEAGAAAAAEPAAAPSGPCAADAAAEDGSPARDRPRAPMPPIAAARRDSRQAWISGFVLGALVFSLGAGGAVLTRSLWAPADEGSAGALAQQLATLEGRLAEIETRVAEAAPPKDLATSDDIARLEGQIASLSAASETRDLAADVKDLRARITALDANVSAGAEAASALGGVRGEVASIQAAQQEIRAKIDELAARDAGKEALLWSAVSALRDALRYTGPFVEELADVRRVAGDRAEFRDTLSVLEPLAERGVASLAELQRAFPATARDIVAAGYGASEKGVLGDVLSRVSQVVTVRPVGEVPGDSAGAIVARAEGQLDRGDLAAALKELDALPEAAKAAAAAWRARAEQRVAADAAISKLNGLLAQQLAAGG